MDMSVENITARFDEIDLLSKFKLIINAKMTSLVPGSNPKPNLSSSRISSTSFFILFFFKF